MCPHCRRSISEGHAAGCPNGPMMPPMVVPIGSPSMTAMEILRRQEYNRAEREVREAYGMGGALTAAQMQAVIEARVELAMADRTGQPPEQVERLSRLRDEVEYNARRQLREQQQIYGSSPLHGVIELMGTIGPEAMRESLDLDAIARALNSPNEILNDIDIRPGAVVRPGRRYEQRPPCAGNRHPTVQAVYDENGSGHAFCTTCGHETADVVVAQRTSADIPTGTSPQRHTVETGTAFNNYAYRCTCGWTVPHSYLMDMEPREVRSMVEAHIAGGQVGPQQHVGLMAGLPEGTKVCPSCGNKSIREARRSGIRQCKDGHHWNRYDMIVGGPTFENATKKPSWETPEISEPALTVRRHIKLEDE